MQNSRTKKKALSLILCTLLITALIIPSSLPVFADEFVADEAVFDDDVAFDAEFVADAVSDLIGADLDDDPYALFDALAADLDAPVADVMTPAAKPMYNASFAGEPAGFRPDLVPAEVKLTAAAGASILYNMAVVPVQDGLAPTNAQINAVAAPTLDSDEVVGPISLASVDETHAVIIKAFALSTVSGIAISDVVTFTYFQRLWVLGDVKAPAAGYTKDEWNEYIVANIIEEMTLPEMQSISNMNQSAPSGYGRLNSSIVWHTTHIPRLGIPNTEMSDGPGGVRTGRTSTCWVTAMGIASTWNTDLMYDFGVANSVECKYFAVDMILAPAFDLCRSPLGGRNFEYYSEDPVVSGYMATAYTKGMQDNGVGVQLKHYVGNDQETSRSGGNVVVSERALRENGIYPFEMAIKEGGAWGIMGSYNRINGVYSCQNTWLQTGVLRNEFGWDGVNVNDYGATSGNQGYDAGSHIATGSTHAVNTWVNTAGISAAERERRIAVAKRNIRYILLYVIKTPNFNNVYDGLTATDITNRSNTFNTAEESPFWASKPVNEAIGGEAVTLFKNNGALPLKTTAANKLKIAVITSSNAGNSARPTGATSSVTNGYMVLQGGGSGQVTYGAAGFVNLLEGLGNANFDVVFHTLDNASGAVANAVAAVAGADVVLETFARTSSEGSDVSRANFDLSANETNMLTALSAACKAKGIPLIGMFNLGGLMNSTMVLAECDAVIDVYDVGFFGANTIGKVLNGDINPSGHTTCTWPVDYNTTTPMIAGAGGLHPSNVWASNPVYYDEDNLFGWRYFVTHDREDAVNIPFGFGLSYTSFEYSDLKLSSDVFPQKSDFILTATVTVKNTGTVAGKDVAELYLGADRYAEEGRAKRDLRGFVKTKLLAPGESQTVSFKLKWRDLAYYDDGTNGWTAAKVNNAYTSSSETTNPGNNFVDNNLDPRYTLYARNCPNSNPTADAGIYGYTDGNGWTVNPGTIFTVQIGNSSDSATLDAIGMSAEFTYGDCASISAPAVWNSDNAQYLEYDISALVGSANVIEISALFDTTLEYVGSVIADGNGFSFLGAPVFDAETGIYKANLAVLGGLFSSPDSLKKILTVQFKAKGYIAYNYELVGTLLSFVSYDDGLRKPVGEYNPQDAKTFVDNYLRWDITDGLGGGPDGRLNLADLSMIISRYYGVKAGDALWAEAAIFDADGNGIITGVDILAIYAWCEEFLAEQQVAA